MKLKKFSSIDELEVEIEAYEKITEKKFETLKSVEPHIAKEKLLRDGNSLPRATNGSKTSNKFKSRKNYKELVNEMYFPNGEGKFKNGFLSPLDTWYKRPLYGRVDNKNNLIYHNYWIFTNISDDPDNPICVFDFVGDAFANMKSIYFSTKLSNSSQFLADLKAQNGLESTINLEEKYQAHIEQVYQEFESGIGQQLRFSKKIKNFDDFAHEFVRFCINESKIMTFSGYVDSLKSDIYDSYLAFDVLPATVDGSDKRKIDFLKDKNYFVYEYAARQAGFSIDPNKPWRLIVNLNSKPIVDIMKKKYFQMDSFLDTEPFVKKISDPEQYNISGIDFNEPTVLVSDIKIEQMSKLLYFIDYFRIELFDDLKAFNKLKELIQKYSIDKRLKKRGLTGDQLDQNYGALMQIDPDPQNPDAPFGVLTLFAQVYYLVVEELQEKQSLVEFIYDSVRKEKQILKFSNKKNIWDVSTDQIYNSVFSSVYDYSYFTYFPIKLDSFYDMYIKKYPHYGSFHKSTNKLSSLFSKNERVINELDDIRTTKNLQNDFFDEKFLNLYLDLRIKEENLKISKQVRNLILMETKEVYSKAVEFYENNNSEYTDFRNITLKIIEGFIGFPYNKQSPIEESDIKKKATMIAHNVYFNKNLIEPRIQTERLCCRLPELSDIIAEKDPCPDFIPQEPVKEEPPPPAPKTPKPKKVELVEIKPTNPCCKFRNVSNLFSNDAGSDQTVPGPLPANADELTIAKSKLYSKLYDMYEAFNGYTGAKEREIVKDRLQQFSDEERCYLCRRPSEFKDGGSFMKYVQGDITAGIDDTEMASYFVKYLRCNEFGKTTFTPKPDNEDNALNKGQQPIIKFQQSDGSYKGLADMIVTGCQSKLVSKDEYENKINSTISLLKEMAAKPGTVATPGWFAVRKSMEALPDEDKAYMCENKQTDLKVIALFLSASNNATGISYDNFYEFMVGSEEKKIKITGWLNCKCGKGKLGC